MTPPTRLEVLTAVRDLASRELDLAVPIVPASRLVEDLALDSIRMLTLAVAVEDHFGICLDEDDEKRLVTVGDLVAVVVAKSEGESERGASDG